MPKFTVSKSALKRKWIAGEKDFSLEGETIFCKPCGKQFNFERKCQLEQHKKTTVHAANIQKQGNKRQRLLSECPPETGERPSGFVNDLVAVMLQEAIPLQKLDKETPLRKFVEKYWESEAIPCVKTLRTKVAPATHFQVIEKIRDEIEDSPIWCSVDETTDRLGRNMVNVIVGKLSGKRGAENSLERCTRNYWQAKAICNRLCCLYAGG
ncbi:hypothetical protein GE061_004066 [Apolygus lucorum]|uniref:Uncharacterized protein n=1 Tax=Apolygus lucorum TaxID=248454 RepID=A0A8S9WY54_APOLU|nr:hypothetical protein GE061_004066 [Apolygus lucorum]